MKDYHDLVIIIREDAVDVKKLKAAVKSTFNNRGTILKKIFIPTDQISKIQAYWSAYFKSLDTGAQSNLNNDIQLVIDEINIFCEKEIF